MAKRTTRVYWRMRSYGLAAYGDFRDYADVGGGQEALIAEGEDRPTSDSDTATRLVTERLSELENARKVLVERRPMATPPKVPLRTRRVRGSPPPPESGPWQVQQGVAPPGAAASGGCVRNHRPEDPPH